MPQRDYLMRMIEQMGSVLARLRQLIMGGGQVESELLKTARSQGVDLVTARALDAESLLALLSAGGPPDITRTWLMAELIGLDGLNAELAGDGVTARESYRKALVLFRALDPHILGGLPDATARIADLEQRVSAPL